MNVDKVVNYPSKKVQQVLQHTSAKLEDKRKIMKLDDNDNIICANESTKKDKNKEWNRFHKAKDMIRCIIIAERNLVNFKTVHIFHALDLLNA